MASFSHTNGRFINKNKLSHTYAFVALLPMAQLVSDCRFYFATLDL